VTFPQLARRLRCRIVLSGTPRHPLPSTWDAAGYRPGQGDIDRDGLWYIRGRGDDTLKIAGRRLGPAEAESILVRHRHIVEAAAIGVPHEVKGNELVLFVVPRKNIEASNHLRNGLIHMIAAEMGKALTPRAILFVSDLPKTRNAKVMRRVIRAAHLGQELGDTSSPVYPEAVEEIKRAR
jgi:acetyl-CoA synthetase